MLVNRSMKSGTFLIRFLLRFSASISHNFWMHFGTAEISLKLRSRHRLPSSVHRTQFWAIVRVIVLLLVCRVFFPFTILLQGDKQDTSVVNSIHGNRRTDSGPVCNIMLPSTFQAAETEDKFEVSPWIKYH